MKLTQDELREIVQHAIEKGKNLAEYAHTQGYNSNGEDLNYIDEEDLFDAYMLIASVLYRHQKGE